MLSALRQELQEMLATVPTLRRPALRRGTPAGGPPRRPTSPWRIRFVLHGFP